MNIDKLPWAAPRFSTYVRQFIDRMTRELFPEPAVFVNAPPTVKGRAFGSPLARGLYPQASTAEMDPRAKPGAPSAVDIALRTTSDGKTSVHLLNCADAPLPDRHNFTDFIPRVGPIVVRMKLAAKPKTARLIPDGGMRWTWNDGRLTVTIPQLYIHGVLVVD